MPLTLIKEDGSGLPDANSYADAADGDVYFDGHLYASAWTAATTGNKEKALVFASRVIDAQCHFNGFRAHESQALQWPREQCPDPDKAAISLSVLLILADNYVDPTIVPKAVRDATCEMARELLISDRTAAPPGEGISSDWTSTSGIKYSKEDTRPTISYLAQAMLAKYGSIITTNSGPVDLIRV